MHIKLIPNILINLSKHFLYLEEFYEIFLLVSKLPKSISIGTNVMYGISNMYTSSEIEIS